VEGGKGVGAVVGVLLGDLVLLIVVMIVGKSEANSAFSLFCNNEDGGMPLDAFLN
jgi:hypothetical protein